MKFKTVSTRCTPKGIKNVALMERFLRHQGYKAHLCYNLDVTFVPSRLRTEPGVIAKEIVEGLKAATGHFEEIIALLGA